MAQFNDTNIKGELNVEESLSQTDYKYNISTIENDENNDKMIIGDDRIETNIKGKEININSDTKTIIGPVTINTDRIILSTSKSNLSVGTDDPINTGSTEGQLYFKMIE
jgi:hypothetical protein